MLDRTIFGLFLIFYFKILVMIYRMWDLTFVGEEKESITYKGVETLLVDMF